MFVSLLSRQLTGGGPTSPPVAKKLLTHRADGTYNRLVQPQLYAGRLSGEYELTEVILG